MCMSMGKKYHRRGVGHAVFFIGSGDNMSQETNAIPIHPHGVK